jgi:hypothetical protein
MKTRLFVLLVFLGLIATSLFPTGVEAGKHVTKGEGKDANGLAFSFQARGTPTSATGRVSFSTFSFGNPTGAVDCHIRNHRRAALSGVLDQPVSGLTHFLIIVKDNGPTEHRPKDEITTWLRNGPFDCAAELGGSLATTERIRKGEITVQ